MSKFLAIFNLLMLNVVSIIAICFTDIPLEFKILIAMFYLGIVAIYSIIEWLGEILSEKRDNHV